jgi:Tyrosine phosphatase family
VIVTIENFGTVAEGDGWTLYRCGQPDDDGFRELLRLGVNTILKMNATEEFSDAEEIRLFLPGTVEFLPLTTYFPDPDYAREAVRVIQSLTDAGKSVAVHCSHGRDRTGLVIAAWRILVSGWSVERSDEERRRFGPMTSDGDVVECLRGLAGTEEQSPRGGYLRAAYRLADGTVIVTGFRHETSALPSNFRQSGSGYEDGFVDQDGKFLTRAEAAGRPRQPPVAELEITEDSATLSDAELQELGLDSDYLTRLQRPK